MGAVVAPGAGLAGLLGEVDIWAEAAPVMSASAATVAIGSLRMERLQCSSQLSCERAAFEPGSVCPLFAWAGTPACASHIVTLRLLIVTLINDHSVLLLPNTWLD